MFPVSTMPVRADHFEIELGDEVHPIPPRNVMTTSGLIACPLLWTCTSTSQTSGRTSVGLGVGESVGRVAYRCCHCGDGCGGGGRDKRERVGRVRAARCSEQQSDKHGKENRDVPGIHGLGFYPVIYRIRGWSGFNGSARSDILFLRPALSCVPAGTAIVPTGVPADVSHGPESIFEIREVGDLCLF